MGGDRRAADLQQLLHRRARRTADRLALDGAFAAADLRLVCRVSDFCRFASCGVRSAGQPVIAFRRLVTGQRIAPLGGQQTGGGQQRQQRGLVTSVPHPLRLDILVMVGGDGVGRSSAVRIVNLLTPADRRALTMAGDEDVQVDGTPEGERGEDRQEADDGVAEP